MSSRAVGKPHEELSWVAGRHPNLLRDLLEGVPPQVTFRMEVPAGWDRACFEARYSPDAQGFPSVREVAQRSASPTEPADTQSQNRKVTGIMWRTGILRVFPRQPEGHQKRVSAGIGRRKGERRGPEGQDSSHREKKKEKKEKKEKKRRREEATSLEEPGLESGNSLNQTMLRCPSCHLGCGAMPVKQACLARVDAWLSAKSAGPILGHGEALDSVYRYRGNFRSDSLLRDDSVGWLGIGEERFFIFTSGE